MQAKLAGQTSIAQPYDRRPSISAPTSQRHGGIMNEAGPSSATGQRQPESLMSLPPRAAATMEPRTRERRASRASSIRTGPILVASSRPDAVTLLIADQYAHQVSSAALQETDFSAEPLLMDAVAEPPDSFRRQTLTTMDALRGLLLVLHSSESIQLFLRADLSDFNWYTRQTRWSDNPVYILKLLGNPAAAGLFILLGSGVVLFQQSRLQLGWSRWQLLRHFAKRGILLMGIHYLLALDFRVRADGPTLVENLLLFTYGVTLILLGLTTVALQSIEKRVLQYIMRRNAEILEVPRETDALIRHETQEEAIARKAENMAYWAGNAILIVSAAGFLAMNMLAVPGIGTTADDMTEWFWFWIMPRPAYDRRTMVYPSTISSQYTPLNWMPFGLTGILYARFITRHDRSRISYISMHLIAAAGLLLFFVLTRLLHFGNLSSSLLPLSNHTSQNPYLRSWQAFFYTVKLPPDLAYSTAALGVVSLLQAAIIALPLKHRDRLPFLQIGRSPIFFYSLSLLVFRFTANLALTFFGLPTKLKFGPALLCYFTTVVVTWFLCKAYVAFKDARSSAESFWRFL